MGQLYCLCPFTSSSQGFFILICSAVSVIQRMLLNLYLSLMHYYLSWFRICLSLPIFFFFSDCPSTSFPNVNVHLFVGYSLSMALLPANQLPLRMHASFLLFLFSDRPPQHNGCLFMFLLDNTTSSLVVVPPPTFATDSRLSLY